MNTIKTIVSLSLLAVAGAHAADKPTVHHTDTSYVNKVVQGVQQTAIDYSDNRGMSLLLDEKTKPGQLIVSGVSSLARQAGVEPGDVLKAICGTPANLRHLGDMAAVAGDAKVYMTIGGQPVQGSIPALASVKTDEKSRVVLNKSMPFDGVGTVPVVGVPAGSQISEVCVPVRTVEESVRVVAPFDQRLSPDGFLVAGGWVPMTYKMEHKGMPAVVVALPSWNPPQLAKQGK
jgi:hypothetical protein